MLNKRNLIIASLTLTLGITGFNYIQRSTNVDTQILRTVTINAVQDTEDFLMDIESNPELLKDTNYLTTRLELVLSSQEDFMNLKYVNWGNYKTNKSLVKTLLLNQELALKSFLEGKEEEGNMNLEILRDYYNSVNKKGE